MAIQYLQQLVITDSNSKSVALSKVPDVDDLRIGLVTEDGTKHAQFTRAQVAALILELQYFATNGNLRQNSTQV